MFVLSAHSLNYTFKMSTNWPVAVILSTFNWKQLKKSLQFPVSYTAIVYAY